MRIVIAEDSPIYHALMKHHFEAWGMDHMFVSDGSKAWDLLRKSEIPTLALLDWVLPGMDGIELCRRIRADLDPQHYIYAILLTTKNRKRDLLDAMEAGADDYLTKPFYAPELKARVMAGKRILDLQSELLATQESLRIAASHDALTGASNRLEILQVLKQELDRSRRSSDPVGIIFADIDNFKSINDSLGHLAGDRVLEAVSQRLISGVRSYDRVGRYGGEEFLVVLPGCDLKNTQAKAEELLRAVRSDPILTPSGSRLVTVSLGIASTATLGSVALEEILHCADLALYRAKRNGKNRVEAPPPQPAVCLELESTSSTAMAGVNESPELETSR